ncbi:MAG: type II toxin-antitoxin system PemK/MazF family toxin [Burkholderiales bacterium]
MRGGHCLPRIRREIQASCLYALTHSPCEFQAGREMRGRRPMLVLSPRAFNQRTSIVIGLPMTTSRSNESNPFAIKFQGSKGTLSYVLCHQPKSFEWKVREMEARSDAKLRAPAPPPRSAALPGEPGCCVRLRFRPPSSSSTRCASSQTPVLWPFGMLLWLVRFERFHTFKPKNASHPELPATSGHHQPSRMTSSRISITS